MSSLRQRLAPPASFAVAIRTVPHEETGAVSRPPVRAVESDFIVFTLRMVFASPVGAAHFVRDGILHRDRPYSTHL